MKSSERLHPFAESPRRWASTVRHSLSSLSLLRGSTKVPSGFAGDWRRRRRWMESPSPSLSQLLDGCDKPSSLPLRVRVVQTEGNAYEGISSGSLLTLLEFDQDVLVRFECSDETVLQQAVTPGSNCASLAGLPPTLFKILPHLEEHDGKAFASPGAVLACRPVPEQVRALSGYSLDDIGVDDVVEPGDVFVVGTGTCFKNGQECAIWFRLVANDRHSSNDVEQEHRKPQTHREPILFPVNADIEFETNVDDDLYTLRELVDLIKCRHVDLPLRVRLCTAGQRSDEYCEIGGQERTLGETVSVVGLKRRKCVVTANESEIFRLPCEEWPTLLVNEVAVDTNVLAQVLRATLAYIDTVQLRTMGSGSITPRSSFSRLSSRRYSTTSSWSNGSLLAESPSPTDRQQSRDGGIIANGRAPKLPPRPGDTNGKRNVDCFADYADVDPAPKPTRKTPPPVRNVYEDAKIAQKGAFPSGREAKEVIDVSLPDTFREKAQIGDEGTYEVIERKKGPLVSAVNRKDSTQSAVSRKDSTPSVVTRKDSTQSTSTTVTPHQHEMLTRELSHSPRKNYSTTLSSQAGQRDDASPPSAQNASTHFSSSSGEECAPASSPSPTHCITIGNYDVPRVTSPARHGRSLSSTDQKTSNSGSSGGVIPSHSANQALISSGQQSPAAALTMMGSHWRQRCESLRLQLADAQRELADATEEIARLKQERQELMEREAVRARLSPRKVFPVYEYHIPRSHRQAVNPEGASDGHVPVRCEIVATS